MTFVDARLRYEYSYKARLATCQSAFYERLTDELIDGKFDYLKNRYDLGITQKTATSHGMKTVLQAFQHISR